MTSAKMSTAAGANACESDRESDAIDRKNMDMVNVMVNEMSWEQAD